MRSILIIDDEPNVRLVFRTTLESSGYDLAEVENGHDALEWLNHHRADLLLLDLQMPTMGGMEVLERLRSSGSNVPVIIVTAHGSIPDAVAAMKLGAIDFLSKPLTPDALRRAVSEVLGRVPEESRPRKGSESESADQHKNSSISRSPANAMNASFVSQLGRAKLAINRRDFDAAEVLLQRAIDIAPTSPEALNLLGVLHESRGRIQDSYESYRAALKADRRYEPARVNMQRYYERSTFGRSELPVDSGDV
jgi:DNA-binding response OmpR family regulator